MEKVKYIKEFLESSTIHGLVHISTSGRFGRLFWIVVVMTGFSIAGSLINQSFDNWHESPSKSTVEIKPIKDFTFPNLTICPPQKTFLNLNYDLLMLEDRKLNNSTRQELLEYTDDNLYDIIVNETLSLLEREEENRFYNWYHHLSSIFTADEDTTYKIFTYAITGAIQSPYYGEQYHENKMEKTIQYDIEVILPNFSTNISNITMTVEIEREPCKKPVYELLYIKKYWFYNGTIWDTKHTIPNHKNFHNQNFSFININTEFKYRQGIKLYYYINVNDVKTIEQKMMPGFRIKWFYNENIEEYPLPDNYYNKEFTRFVNAVSDGQINLETLKNIRAEMLNEFQEQSIDRFCGFIIHATEATNLGNEKIEQKINKTADYSINSNIDRSVIENAGKLFLYMNLCPFSKLKMLETKNNLMEFTKKLLNTESPRKILLTLNRLRLTLQMKQRFLYSKFYSNLLYLINEKLGLSFLDIRKLVDDSKTCDKNCSIQKEETFKAPIVKTVTNHPVFSSSSFLPYCGFGSGFTASFDFPACNHVQQKLRNKQLCYEVVPPRYGTTNRKDDLRKGFFIMIDENKDKEFVEYLDLDTADDDDITYKDIFGKGTEDDSSIILHTIGRIKLDIIKL